MPLIRQAIAANDVLIVKGVMGMTPTAQDYELAINLNNRVLNEGISPDTALTVMLGITTMSANAVQDGYTVNYKSESDTFTVTKGGC